MARIGRKSLAVLPWREKVVLGLAATVVALVMWTFISAVRTTWKAGRRPAANGDALCLFVQVSPTNIGRLPMFIDAIWHERNIYIVHFDADIDAREVRRTFESCPLLNTANVVRIPSRKVSWGGISIVLNTIDAMETALRLERPFTHFINTSPSDFPLMGMAHMREALLSWTNATFGDFTSVNAYHARGDRVERLVENMHVDGALFNATKSEIVKVHAHPLVSNLLSNASTLVKGESWLVLARPAVEHVVTSTDAKRWLVMLGGARAPDEWVLQNIVVSDPVVAENAYRDHMRYIVWHYAEHKNHGSHPLVLDKPEVFWPEIRTSGALFARKFDGSAGASDLEGKIRDELWHSDEYLALVNQRMARACRASGASCRDGSPSAGADGAQA